MRAYRFPFVLLTLTAACGAEGTFETDDAEDSQLTPEEALVSGLSACGATLDAKSDMRASAGSAYSEGWGLWSNGSLSFSKTIGTERSLSVRAKGDFGAGQWPLMEVRMGGRLLAAHRVSQAAWASYTTPLPPGTSGNQPFTLTFPNDANDRTSDRNLRVQSASFSCAQQTACTPGTWDARTQMTASAGGVGKEAWNLWSNGTLSASHAFAGGGTVVVRAQGVEGQGWPQMSVEVGGTSLGTKEVNVAQYRDYSFAIPAAASGTLPLRVRYANDAVGPGWDRNLLVAKVEVRCPGTTTPTQPPAPRNDWLNGPAGWTSIPTGTVTGQVTASFTMRAKATGIDAVVGLGLGKAADYSDLAAIVRMSAQGVFDVRDGGDYVADRSVAYEAGKVYTVEMAVNLAAGIYDVWVTPQTGTRVQLVSGVDLRTERRGISSIDHISVYEPNAKVDLGNVVIGTKEIPPNTQPPGPTTPPPGPVNCGDGVCQLGESPALCPSDCKAAALSGITDHFTITNIRGDQQGSAFTPVATFLDPKTGKEVIYTVVMKRDNNVWVARHEVGGSTTEFNIGRPPNTDFDRYHTIPSIGVDDKGYVHVIGPLHHTYLEGNYWVSKQPNAIGAGFEERGRQMQGFRNRGEHSAVTYPVFFNDRQGKLYVAYRLRVRFASGWQAGVTGLSIGQYDSGSKTWAWRGGNDYNPLQDGTTGEKTVAWTNKPGRGADGAYQAWVSHPFFDRSNRLHLAYPVCNNEPDNGGYCREVHYMYSDDEGVSWRTANGASLTQMPHRPDATSLAIRELNASGQGVLAASGFAGSLSDGTIVVSVLSTNSNAISQVQWRNGSWQKQTLPMSNYPGRVWIDSKGKMLSHNSNQSFKASTDGGRTWRDTPWAGRANASQDSMNLDIGYFTQTDRFRFRALDLNAGRMRVVTWVP